MRLFQSASMHWVLLPLLVVASGGSVSAGSGDARRIGAASRPWPLPITVSLSSSFGEYRDGHIHAGLDIRTNGREGIACAAVGDGAITRMRASYGGYGRALYLKLETGETVVYAHLSEFSPALERYLCDAQVEQGNYTVDLFIPASRFPVREGDVIAYSGSTGTGAPHLHFEVRDIRENPVNPLSRGWKLIDDRRPEPKRVLWMPASAAALIDGTALPREVSLLRTAPGRYSARDTVTIAGSAGLGIDAIDRSDPHSGKLAPSKIELSVDGALMARIERERFSYDQTGEVALEYELERVRTRNEQFLFLFDRRGETLGGRTFVNGGLICADSLAARGINRERGGNGIHTADIDLYDKNGNSAHVTIPFRTGADIDGRGRGGPGHTLFGFEDFLSIGGGYAVPGGIADAPPAPGGDHSPGSYGSGILTFDSAAGQPVPLFDRERRGMPSVYCLPVPAGESRTFTIPDLGMSLRSRSSSLYARSFMLLSGDVAGSPAPPEDQGLEPLSKPVFFGPWSLAIRTRVDIDFALPAPVTGSEAVYRWNASSMRWSVAPSHAEGDTVSASLRNPGIYRVCRDTVPPVVAAPVLTRHRMYATGAVYPEIVTGITDAGSGVNAEATELAFDGRAAIGRWDPYRKKMFILLREENIMGEHAVTIVARDLAGNETRIHSTINFSEAVRPDSMNGSN